MKGRKNNLKNHLLIVHENVYTCSRMETSGIQEVFSFRFVRLGEFSNVRVTEMASIDVVPTCFQNMFL